MGGLVGQKIAQKIGYPLWMTPYCFEPSKQGHGTTFIFFNSLSRLAFLLGNTYIKINLHTLLFDVEENLRAHLYI